MGRIQEVFVLSFHLMIFLGLYIRLGLLRRNKGLIFMGGLLKFSESMSMKRKPKKKIELLIASVSYGYR